MSKVKVPSSSDGIEQFLSDPRQVANLLNEQGQAGFKELARNYGMSVLAKDGDLQEQIREQTQMVAAEMLQKNSIGASRAPVSYSNGRPQLQLDPEGTATISHGKGAVYNKYSTGARFEQKTKAEDRFGSIGEMLMAIREFQAPTSIASHDELMRKLNIVRSFQNSLGSEEPSAGGFLIPEIMRSDLLQLALENSIVRPRATVIPMSTLRVSVPSVDDTSHVSSLFGGVSFNWTEESASIAESQPSFAKISLDAKKLTGFLRVPNEMLEDAPAFSSWFDTRVPAGLAWAEDLAFMTETGNGTPQGFINCPAAVSVAKESGQTTGTVVYENLTKMYARMLPQSLGNAVWICDIQIFQQLATMALSVGTGGGPVWINSFSGGAANTPPMTIFGRPVYYTEKVSALSTTGDINFVDLSYYLIGDRQSIAVTASEHAFFQNDQTSYKIIERVDGRPWLQSPLTPHNGGSTLSAFVQLATR